MRLMNSLAAKYRPTSPHGQCHCINPMVPGRSARTKRLTKLGSCLNVNFLIIGSTAGCRYDSVRCHQWRQNDLESRQLLVFNADFNSSWPYGYMLPYGYMIWFNIGSGNGLLSNGIKPLPEPMAYSQKKSRNIHLRVISQEIPQAPIIKLTLNIWILITTYLIFHSNIPGANVLEYNFQFLWSIASALLLNLLWEMFWKIFLKISQCWIRQWLGDVRQQAITWPNVDRDLQRRMASMGPTELTLTHWGRVKLKYICVSALDIITRTPDILP